MQKKITENIFGTGIIIFTVAVVVALPLRMVQYFTVLEPSTGFYSETGFTVWMLYGVLLAAAVALVTLGFAKRNTIALSNRAEKLPGCGAFAAVVSAGCVFDFINCFTTISKNNEEIITSVSQETVSNLETLNKVFILQAVFAVASALFFILSVAGFFTGKGNGEKYKLLSLTPVIWEIFRLISRFTRSISFIRVSELMLEMLMMAFFILFFAAYAQANSRVGTAQNGYKIASYGLTASMLAFVCFVPRLILTLFGKAELLYSQAELEFCDIACALFAVSVVATRIVYADSDAPVEQDDEEENSVVGE